MRNEAGADAVYLASFSQGHAEPGILGLVSLGEWGGADSNPVNRVAFGFRLWATEGQSNVQIVDIEETPWADEQLFGQPLSRVQALAHPLLPEVFHLTDHLVAEDGTISLHLQGEAAGGGIPTN